MKNKHDSAEVSVEQKSKSVEKKTIVRLQREIERISEEQMFLWELNQRDMQRDRIEQYIIQEQHDFFQDQKLIASKLETIINQAEAGYYEIITFHKTKPYLDEKGILRHKEQNKEGFEPNNAVYLTINGQKASLCTRINGKTYYIQNVAQNEVARLTRNPVWSEIKTNADGSIAIRFEQGFLSAKKTGEFSLVENDSGWEQFKLRDLALPVILEMAELLGDLHSSIRFPWEAVKTGSRIVIYGGGIVGRIYLRQLARSSYCTVVAICDKNPKETGILGVPVFGVQELYRMNPETYDVILIAEEKKKIAMEIRDELKLAGISMEKVKWLDPLRK